MAIRDKIRDKAAPQLRPGEQIQAVIGAQTASQWWVALAYFVFFAINEYRCIVVTDQRIVTFNSGRFASANPKEIVTEAPRATRIGPPTGILWYVTEATGEKLHIHKRFHKDIEQADAQAPRAA